MNEGMSVGQVALIIVVFFLILAIIAKEWMWHEIKKADNKKDRRAKVVEK